jgi:hypothetical protein
MMTTHLHDIVAAVLPVALVSSCPHRPHQALPTRPRHQVPLHQPIVHRPRHCHRAHLLRQNGWPRLCHASTSRLFMNSLDRHRLHRPNHSLRHPLREHINQPQQLIRWSPDQSLASFAQTRSMQCSPLTILLLLQCYPRFPNQCVVLGRQQLAFNDGDRVHDPLGHLNLEACSSSVRH